MRDDFKKIKIPVIYTLLGLTTISTIGTCSNTEMIRQQYESAFEIQARDRVGDATPDRFYDVGGTKAFIEIDGVPVEKNKDLYKPKYPKREK